MQAVRCTRPGAGSWVRSVSSTSEIARARDGVTRWSLGGGPAQVHRFLPGLIDLVWTGQLDPSRVSDLTLPLDQVAEAYRAMDEGRASKCCSGPDHAATEAATCSINLAGCYWYRYYVRLVSRGIDRI